MEGTEPSGQSENGGFASMTSSFCSLRVFIKRFYHTFITAPPALFCSKDNAFERMKRIARQRESILLIHHTDLTNHSSETLYGGGNLGN